MSKARHGFTRPPLPFAGNKYRWRKEFTENERLEAPAFRHGEEKPLSFVSKIRTCYTP